MLTKHTDFKLNKQKTTFIKDINILSYSLLNKNLMDKTLAFIPKSVCTLSYLTGRYVFGVKLKL